MRRHSSKEDSKVLNSAQVANCEFSVSVGSKRPHVFDITTEKKTFYVQCDSDVMLNHWLGVLNDAQFYFRQQAAEAEAVAVRAAAPTMIGIGLVLKASTDTGLFTIEDIVQGGPADKSQKFQAGDFIVEVDGHDTYNQSFDDVLGWIRGELGTFLTMVLARVFDFDVMQRTASPENPFGDAADVFSIELRRDVVKKVDIYSHYPNAVVSPPLAATSAFRPAPPVASKPEPAAAAAPVSARPSVAARASVAAPTSFVFEGCLGKSKGTGLMGMIGYQDRYFTVDANHITWSATWSSPCLKCTFYSSLELGTTKKNILKNRLLLQLWARFRFLKSKGALEFCFLSHFCNIPHVKFFLPTWASEINVFQY
jgi:hypothetical protein